MSEMLVFFIGLFVGAPIGLLITSLLASGKTEDMMNEISDLRKQQRIEILIL